MFGPELVESSKDLSSPLSPTDSIFGTTMVMTTKMEKVRPVPGKEKIGRPVAPPTRARISRKMQAVKRLATLSGDMKDGSH